MASDDGSSQLEQAIASVLSGQNVSAANDYILLFVDTEQAWTASMVLCTARTDNDNVRYFAANILYTKVRKHWSQLAEDKREHLYRFLSEVILTAGSVPAPAPQVLKLFLSRIALTLCSVCSRSSCGIQQFLQSAFALLDLSSSSSSSLLPSLGLEMLTMAPGEVEALDISRALRLELQEQLQNSLPQILLLVDAISSGNQSEAQVLEVIRLLTSWLSQGVTLSTLFEDHRCIFNMLWRGLQSGNEALTVQCCTFLREVISLAEFPRTNTRDQAVVEIVRMVTASGAALAPFFGEDADSDNAAHEVCCCLVSIVCGETALISSPTSCNIDFFYLLLNCTGQRSRKIAALTFDAWVSLQDIPVAARHPFLHSQIYSLLLASLLSHCQYVDGFNGWEAETVDDEDDFFSFRDSRQGLQEVLVVCFYALQGDFFQALTDRIMSTGDSWQVLEAALYVLHSVMDSAKGLINRCQPGSAPVNLLVEFTNRAISMDPSQAPIYILESACKFLGSITFFTVPPVGTPQRGPELFFPALQFLFCIYACDLSSHGHSLVAVEAIEKVASKSIHQLCIKGSHLFCNPADPYAAYQKIVGLVEMTAQILSSRCERVAATGSAADSSDASLPLLLLVEAATRTITIAVPIVDSARNLMAILGSPVIIGLTYELDMSVPKRQKTELLLGTATQMIKFSDQTNVDQGQLIGEFLVVLWPLLKKIPCHPLFGVTASVTNELFSLYRSAILSAKALVLPELCSIASVVVSYLHASLAAGMSRESGSLSVNSNSNALQCASSVVEALAGQSDGLQMLSTLLEQITEAVFSVLQSDYQQSKKGEPVQSWRITDETIDKYFSYVYLYLLLCPEVLSTMPVTVRKVVYVLRMSLSLYKERGALRAALHVLQSLFSPTTAKLVPYHEMLLEIGCELGEEIVNQVMRSLCGEVQSSLFPNLIDALISILGGCEDRHPDRSRAWVFSALSDESIVSLHLLTPSDKQLVLSAVFRLIGSDKRRCKALLQDFSRICCSESTPDCLLSYEE